MSGGRRTGGDTIPVQVVAFDWGGTLMEDPGIYAGPMAHWPVVAALPGAAHTLAALGPHYRLVVATNADDSGAQLVLAALARVGLDGPIEAVFSSADLGIAKPHGRFYRSMVERLGVPAAAVVMVGDDYVNDVAGALAAGLRAVWLDRRGSGAEPSAAPQRAGGASGERETTAPAPRIRTLTELPDLLRRLTP